MKTVEDLRCSSWARSQDVDPIGSAGSTAGFLLIDWPLPWPRDISEIAELSAVVAACRKADIRIQAVVPTDEHESRVSLYRWDPGLGRFAGVESPVDGRPADVALELLAGRIRGKAVDRVDVLICGHGNRDRCCGGQGTALALEVAAGGGRSRSVAVRRSSHIGGHRFAPNALVLPAGTCWGYLDSAALECIVTKSGPVEGQLHRYRGCAGLRGAAVQAVERAVLAQVGWSLLDSARYGVELGNGRVRFSAIEPGGGFHRWEATAVTRRVLPVPPCGSSVFESDKTEAELGVEGLVALGPRYDDAGRSMPRW